MKKCVLVFCVVAAAVTFFVSCSDNDDYDHFGSVSGTVTSRADNTAISNASVTLSPGGAVRQTDVNGSYKFENLEPGDYSVNVQHTNYKTDNSIVTVRVGENATVNFSLEGAN